MPHDDPPPGVRPRPRFTQLPAGSFLWRIARRARNDWSPGPAEAAGYAPPWRPDRGEATIPAGIAGLAGLSPASGLTSVFQEFDEAAFDEKLAGRFDPTPQCPYPYCYAALDDLTAICEVLLRDVSTQGSHRYVPRKAIADLQLTILETRTSLWLVSLLDAADLAAAGQDSWLIHAESAACYDTTRRWAHWLRDSETPDGSGPPAGLVWRSKREPAGQSVLLFGDRCGKSVVYSPFGVRPLDTGEGLDWLNRRLELLRTRIRVSPPMPGWR